ncbi:MAG: DUF6492 family protein [Verrucomicrobiota bacterium]
MDFDIVIPLFRKRWCTRSVLEGLFENYAPHKIFVICPSDELGPLAELIDGSKVGAIELIAEEGFFLRSFDLDKESIGSVLNPSESLYPMGWYYQQLLKLGAGDGISDLSEDYLVWDSDLLPVATWPVVDEQDATNPFRFALLQDNTRGNKDIIAKWEKWIKEILKVSPVVDPAGTFVPHHLWFNQSICREISDQLGAYFDSQDPWPLLMMQSANEFGTFSEFWLYCSWLNSKYPEKLSYYPYDMFGSTTERFFDDGTGHFSKSMNARFGEESTEPSYEKVMSFISEEYKSEKLPSSISFESSPRHLKKGIENMHTEELRSRWHKIEETV